MNLSTMDIPTLLNATQFRPDRLSSPDSWIGHIPFAAWIMQILQPSTFVELGTYSGNSYLAFCQSVSERNLSTKCYAVDTWQGDEHSGLYDQSVFQNLHLYHQKHYEAFSRLLRMTFDDASLYFSDGSIDLLHIDGSHGYDTVKHDFEIWLPKLSPHAVVLFHDTNVRERGFGVWKFWEELCTHYPLHLEFAHSHGLGVLQLSQGRGTFDLDWLEPDSQHRPVLLNFFSATGQHTIQQYQNEMLTAQAAENDQTLQTLKKQALERDNELNSISIKLNQQEQVLQSLNDKLWEIYGSRAWQVVQYLWKIRLAFIPSNGLVYQTIRWLYKKFLTKQKAVVSKQKATEVVENETSSTDYLLKNSILEDIRGHPTSVPTLEDHPQLTDQLPENNIAKAPHEHSTQTKITTDQDDYLSLTERIESIKQFRLSNFTAKKPLMVNLDEQDLSQVAATLDILRQTNPEISIIIPNYNHAQLTLECLITIARQADEISYEIIIVDDGSDAETVEILRSIPHISLIQNNRHVGFTLSCNQGAKAARGKYLVFLNNDTQVLPGWLKSLLDVFINKDQVGAVGPKVLFPGGHLQEAGNLVNRDGTTEFVGWMDNPDLPRYNFPREVDYCSGVSLMVRADIFNEIGRFEELYSPAYYEDVDLCFKLRSRGLKIYYCPDAVIVHHLNATSDKIGSTQKFQWSERNHKRFIGRWQEAINDLNRIKLIAFYLPQFHRIPENDLWWGKGFSEWTSVTSARPNFEGHYQPHIPADLGFYDLRIAEVMEQQVELAKKYNIYGFCYYYYWFGGKRILEMPLDRMLEHRKPDFPFCLCWANENWSRRWDGSDNELLLKQDHSEQDDQSVIKDMIRYLCHPNYIRIDGKPILLIYRVELFPDIQRTVQIWRDICRQENLGEIHLVMVESFNKSSTRIDPHRFGMDASVEFPPHNMMTPDYQPEGAVSPDFSGTILNYRTEVLKYATRELPNYPRYHTVMPSRDNTARKQHNAFILDQSTPGKYQAWLESSLQKTREQMGSNQRILFINAWNEWAEGNHLEPDQRYGLRYLEATRNALNRFQ